MIRNFESYQRMIVSCSLSPVLRGEGWGEGPSVKGRDVLNQAASL